MKFLPASIFRKTSLVIVFCINQQVFAQDEYKANVIPPSPDAAALGKFVEVPVSYYTGIPQISVPIYTIQTGNIQLPISISYHAGGVKVEDVASRVGLGWALNAGGVISRSVVGCPDEGSNDCTSFWSGPDPDPQTLTAIEKYGIANSNIDMQPDMYFFNFGNYSGELFFNKNGDCYTIPHTTLKIKPGIGPKESADGSWQITAPDGKIYRFATKESSSVVTVCGASLAQNNRANHYPSSWYLTNVYDPVSTREIDLSYSSINEEYNYAIGITESFNLHTGGSGGSSGSQTCEARYTHFRPQRLETISFDGGVVKFIYDPKRKDIVGSSRLSKVLIESVNGGFNKKFELFHGYFNSEFDEYIAESRRLRLDRVIESSNDGTVTAPYEFVYHDFYGNSKYYLPARGSKDQDYWGYFNGRRNTTTIPYLVYDNPLNGGKQTFYALGNRWPHPEAAKAFILEEIHYPTGGYTKFEYELNEAISDQLRNKFEHEPIKISAVGATPKDVNFSINSFFEGGAVVKVSFFKSICDPNNGEKGSETITFDSGISASDYYKSIGIIVGEPTQIPIDNIAHDGTFSIVNRQIYRDGGSTGGSHIIIPIGLLPPIKGIASLPSQQIECPDVVVDPTYCDEEPNYCPYAEIVGRGLIVASDAPYRIFLNNGNYTLRVHSPVNHNYEIHLEYEKEIDSPNKYAGGLRIKRITHFDPDREKQEVLNDFYYEDENGLSTGTILFAPNIAYSLVNGNSSEYVLGATSNCTMANTHGGVVGYKKVTVLNGKNGVNGKTEYYYSSFEDFSEEPIPNSIPFTPLKIDDWQLGQLMQQIDYRRDGAALPEDDDHGAGSGTGHSYSPVRKFLNHYLNKSIINKVTGYKLMANKKVFDGQYGASIALWEYVDGSYDITSGWTELDYNIEYLYSDQYPGDDDHAKIVRTDYQYNPNNLQVQQITTQTSDSKDIKKSVIVYPCDYMTAEGDFIEELNKNHIINIPIETVDMVEKTEVINGVTEVNNYVLGGILFTYKPEGTGLRDKVYRLQHSQPKLLDDFTFSNQHSLGTLPWNVTKWPFDVKGNYKLEHSFINYDAYGNLLSEQGRDGITTNYEWDAINYYLYPTKKIVNSGNSKEQITSYGYKLLVGLISQTDPNGKTVKYQYDGLGRLKAILDHQDNLVKAYDYQYKVK